MKKNYSIKPTQLKIKKKQLILLYNTSTHNKKPPFLCNWTIKLLGKQRTSHVRLTMLSILNKKETTRNWQKSFRKIIILRNFSTQKVFCILDTVIFW